MKRRFPSLRPDFTVGLIFFLILAIQAVKVSRLIPLESLFIPGSLVSTNFLQAQPTSALEWILAWSFSGFLAPDLLAKGFIFLSLIVCPALIFLASRFFGNDLATSLFAMGLAEAGFINFDPNSAGLIYLGWHAFVFSIYLAVVVTASFFRAVTSGNHRSFITFTILAVLLSLHFASGFLALIPILVVIYGMYWKRMSTQQNINLVVSVLLVLATNIYWIYPYFKYSTLHPSCPMDRTSPIHFLKIYIPSAGEPFQSALMRGVITIMAAGGLIVLRRSGRINQSRIFLFWWLIVPMLALAGPQLIYLCQWIPRSWVLYCFILMIIPCGAYLSNYIQEASLSGRFIVLWILWFQMTWQVADPYAINSIPLAEQKVNTLRPAPDK